MIRVLIVDDHVAIRQMLAVFLKRLTGYEVVGETGSGLEAIRLCTDLRPDLVILDLMLMELDGVEAMKKIRASIPAQRILVYSGSCNLALIRRCLEAGPNGYVEKFSDVNMLREALAVVTAGGKYFTVLPSSLLLKKDRDTPDDLTQREKEVLQSIAEGNSSREILGRLNITNHEFERVRSILLKKITMKSATDPDPSIANIPPALPPSVAPVRKRKSLVKRVLKLVLIAIAAFVTLLYFNQHRLIWLPRHYQPDDLAMLPETAVKLNYTTTQGAQCSFYIPPANPQVAMPARIWVLFCGNGSLALDWLNFATLAPDKNDGFLLFEYPGYGLCEGSAEPGAIKESSEKALAELAAHLHLQPAEINSKLNVIGHSIGCAATLEFASRHPVRRVILAAPFTTLRDMAQRTVGWPLCWLLRHNFDNRARLAELAARAEPPLVTIFHGSDDTLIPPQMGRSLAAMFPKMITFHEIPHAGHNTIVEMAEAQMFEAMKQPSPATPRSP